MKTVSSQIQSVLQEADRAILSLAGGSHYLLYRAVHRFAETLAPLDSFYIGFCQEAERTIVYPYNFDGREYDDPNVNAYQVGGVTEWIVTNRLSYWSSTDKGDLLHRGRAFGDAARRSAEGIVVPIFEKPGRHSPVIGLLSVLSYTPNVYSEEILWAVECLAESLGTALRREREDEARWHRRFGGSSLADVPGSVAVVAGDVGARLKRIRQRVAELRALLPGPGLPCDQKLVQAAEMLAEECERSETETMELLLRAGSPSENPFLRLTTREREVGGLLVAGQTNRQIAERLFVSEKTAKTHVGNIIQKLGAGGRSGAAQMLKPFVPAVYANGVEKPPSSD